MDFTGFYFKNHHSSEFGITRVSDGSRYQENLLPTSEDYTIDIPGSDGQYNFGSNYKTKVFNLDFAFDNISEVQLRKIRNWLSKKQNPIYSEMGDLIFDETPYKRYVVKVTGDPQINYICFEELDKQTGKGKRVYKGEGTIAFTCYNSFAFHNYYKSLNEYRYQIEGVNLFDINNLNGGAKPLEKTDTRLVYQNYAGIIIPIGKLPVEAGKTYYYKYYLTVLDDPPTDYKNYTTTFGLNILYYLETGATASQWLLPRRQNGSPIFEIPEKNVPTLYEGTVTLPAGIQNFGLYVYCENYTLEDSSRVYRKIAFDYITISEEPIKEKYSTLEEWAESSLMKDELIGYDTYDSITQNIKLYNAGDLEADWILTFDKPEGVFNERTFSLSTSDETFSISILPSSDTSGLTASSLENDIVNSKGKIEIDTRKNMVTFIREDGKRVPAYFLIKKGSLFKIPSSLYYDEILLEISGEVLTGVNIEYDYLYY